MIFSQTNNYFVLNKWKKKKKKLTKSEYLWYVFDPNELNGRWTANKDNNDEFIF